MQFEYVPKEILDYVRGLCVALAKLSEDKEAPIWVRSRAVMTLADVESALFRLEQAGAMISVDEDPDPSPQFSTN